jgi:tetratricopeptide (TPR) repeat protein
MLVRSLMVKGDLRRAEGELRSLQQEFPNAAPVQTTVGLLAFGKKDYTAARKAFERALQLDAKSNEALGGLVNLDLATGKTGDAKARIETKLAAAPNDPAILTLAAHVYLRMGNAGQAEQALLKTIQVAPANLQAYAQLGQLYVQQQKLDDARARFEEVAKRQSKPVGAETMIAMILQLQGKNAEAQKRYEKALQIDPHAAVAANNLAWMYAEGAGNLDVALQLAQTAKAALPDAPQVNDTLGWIYLKKDLPGLAIPPLQQAVEKDPKNPTYQSHLGHAYAKAGDAAKARTALETALKLSPTFDGAEAAKKTLASLR